MRIAIIAHLKHAIREPFAGGLEAHTHLLASRLRARGHAVTLFASTRSDPALGTTAICEETALLATGIAEANDVAFFREHHAYLRLMGELRRGGFDVVHNNSLHYLPVSMADTLPAPMVTTLHTPPFCWLESGIRLARERLRLVAVSAATARLWAGVAPVDRVVPNGIELDRFAWSPRAAAEPYLVWHGRIVPEKGLDLAIAAARHAGLPLRIAGPTPDAAFFAGTIAPLLGDGIDHLGHLDRAALARLIGGAAAALVTPRWEEPFGLVAAEALACGTPVAAFARGALPDLLDARCGALAPADDVPALAAAALAAARLSRAAARAHAEATFDVERMIDGYEAVYADMLAAPRYDALPLAGAA